MAGSLNHIVREDGYFWMNLIENLGDAKEALYDCFEIIRELTGGDREKVNVICKKLKMPPIKHNMLKSDMNADFEDDE